MGRRGPQPKSQQRRELEQTKGDKYHKDMRDGSKPVEFKEGDLWQKPKFQYDEGGVASREWDAIRETVAATQLARVDKAALIEWCQLCALREKAWREVQEKGPVLVNDKGVPKINPWLVVMQRQTQVMMSLSTRLGFDPGARAGLRVQDTTPRSKFSGLLNG